MYVAWVKLEIAVLLCASLVACSSQGGTGSTVEKIMVEDHLKPLFSGEPCELPCWENLLIGISTREEAERTLQSLSFINFDSMRIVAAGFLDYETGERVVGERLTVQCKYPVLPSCIRMGIVDGVVIYISLGVGGDLTLGQMSGLLGNPEFVALVPEGIENYTCAVELYWPEYQISATYIENEFQRAAEMCNTSLDSPKVSESYPVQIILIGGSASIEWAVNHSSVSPWSGFSD